MLILRISDIIQTVISMIIATVNKNLKSFTFYQKIDIKQIFTKILFSLRINQ